MQRSWAINIEMESKLNTINVIVMGKELEVSCPSEENEKVRIAAKYIESEFKKIKESSSLSEDNIAALSSLRITNQLLNKEKNLVQESYRNEVAKKLKDIHKKLDSQIKNLSNL